MISTSLIKELREKTGAGMLDCKKALTESNGNIDEAINWLREKGFSTAAKKLDRVAAEGLADVKIDGNNAVIIEVNAETDFVAKNAEFVEMVNDIANVVLNNDIKDIDEALELKFEEGTINDLVVAKTAKIGERLDFRRFAKMKKDSNSVFGSYIHMGGSIAVLALIKGKSEEVATDVAMHAAAMRPKYITRADVPKKVIDAEMEVLKEQAINEGKPAEIAEKIVMGRINKFYSDNCLVEQSFIKDGDITIKEYLKNNDSELLELVRFEVGEGIEKKEDDFAAEVASMTKKD